MPPEAARVQPAVLLTIIAETVLRDPIVKLFKHNNVSGYTINQVQGEGSHGKRMGDMAGYNTNIEIKTLVSREVSDSILWSVKDYQGKHAIIVFRQDVEPWLINRVLRAFHSLKFEVCKLIFYSLKRLSITQLGEPVG